MHTRENSTPPSDERDDPATTRPLGFWLKTVDRLISREVAEAFDDLDVTRREWRLLNLIAGDVRDERLTAKLDARPHLIAALLERGWVAVDSGERRLTDDGRVALASLAERVNGIRARITDAVPADDYATTVATLESIARELGWSDEADDRTGLRFGRGHRGHHGHRDHRDHGRRDHGHHDHGHLDHGHRDHGHGRHHGRGRCAHTDR